MNVFAMGLSVLEADSVREVLNLTNHYNARYFYSSGVDPITGQALIKALIKTLQGLPLTPTAGVVFQF